MKRAMALVLTSLMLFSGMTGLLVPSNAATSLWGPTLVSVLEAGYYGQYWGDEAYHVAYIGDVNDDGIGDIAVGAPQFNWTAVGSHDGAVHIVFGRSTGWTNTDQMLPWNKTLVGNGPNDHVGVSVAAAGDVDGDGRDDFIVGAPGNDTGGTDAGAAYLVFGRYDNEWAFATYWDVEYFVQLVGENAGDQAGHSVAGGVDVNRDGVDDIIVSAPYFDKGGASNCGKVYVIYGHTGSWPSAIDLSQANASYVGDQVDEHMGLSVSGAGDLNGDDYDDIAMGSPNHTRASNEVGIVYTVLGSTSLKVNASIATYANASFPGINDTDETGFAIAGGGDIDVDGFDDLLIGAPGYRSSLAAQGVTYIVYGNDTTLVKNVTMSNVPRYLGEGAGDRFGAAVSFIGHLYGDPEVSFAVGAPTTYGTDEGSVYLFLGSYTRLQGEVGANNCKAILIGTAGNDRVGAAVSGGDVDGDGTGDILLGGILDNNTGRIWVGFEYVNQERTEQEPIQLYLDEWCNNMQYHEAPYGHEVCIFLRTADPDGSARNVVKVTIEPDNPGGVPLEMYLFENGAGEFYGRFEIMPDGMTNKHRKWVGAPKGAELNIYVTHNSTNNASLNVSSIIMLDSSFDMYHGAYPGDRIGDVLTVLGDVNGDGIDDIAFGNSEADQYGEQAGIAYVFFGKDDPIGYDVNVTTADLILTPTSEISMLGSGIAGGDVNNDGLADIIVGAPLSSFNNVPAAGAVFIIFGRETGWPSTSSITDMANVTYFGEKTGDGAGFRISSGADVNGDGIDDILLSAIAAPEWTFTGWVYLLTGREEGWPESDTLANATAIWKGANAVDWAGNSLSIKGDVNGDHICDILIGAYGNDIGGTEAGNVYLVFGRRSGWRTDWNLTKDYTASIRGGTAPIDGVGHSVAFAGDLDRDDKDDLFISSGHDQGNDYGGTVHFIKGKESWSKNNTISSVTSTRIVGSEPESRFELAYGIGDFNNDNIDDAVLMDPWAEAFLQGSGMASVLYGRDQAYPSLLNMTRFGRMGYGDQYLGEYNKHLGMSAAGGDIDGDGWNDILVGCRGESDQDKEEGYVYIIKRGTNARPSAVTSLEGFTDGGYSIPVGEYLNMNSWLWLRLTGTDSDPTTVNTAEVHVSSMVGDPNGFKIRLIETNEKSGIFEGELYLYPNAPPNGKTLRVIRGDHVDIHWVSDPTKNITFKIESEPRLESDETDFFIATEDVMFDHRYWVENASIVTWSFSTDFDYIYWDEENTTVWGTPRNNHVGQGGYSISIVDDQGKMRKEDLGFIVRNVAPAITTTLEGNVTNLTEDRFFEIDINSSDDGQGIITWAMKTNATGDWFSFNGTTGVLNGTPTNDEVGLWWFNVTVDDGNTGKTSKNFTLNVSNTNDLPVFLTTPSGSAIEGLLYRYVPDVEDVDGDPLTFSLDTAIANMTINEVTGIVNWVPMASQIGNNSIVINVTDGTGYMIQAFNVTVLRQGSIPLVSLDSPLNGTTIDQTNPELGWIGQADENVTLTYTVYFSTSQAQVKVLDPSIIKADGITDDYLRVSNLVKGTDYYWTVIPYDGDAPGLCVDGFFWFKVSDTATANNPPTLVGTPPEKAYVDIEYTYKVNATDPDPFDKVTFSLSERPTGMLIDAVSGTISWRPTQGQVGVHNVTAVASDGKASSRLSWKITVSIWGNNLPYLTKAIANKTATVGQELRFTITASDDDGDTLSYSLGPNTPAGVTLNGTTGLLTWTPTKDQVGEHAIVFKISDGKGEVSFKFNVTVKERQAGDQGVDMLLVGGILAIVIVVVAIIAVLAARRRNRLLEEAKKMVIDDIFLISRDGRLIAHHARRIRPDMDGELLGGMFTAVQDFIGSSFKPDEDTKGSINEIRYGEYRVLIEHGRYVFIAVSAQGEDAKQTIASMKRSIDAIERRYRSVLETWDGDVAPLKEARKAMACIISGEDPSQVLGLEVVAVADEGQGQEGEEATGGDKEDMAKDDATGAPEGTEEDKG